jgi:hypothetical protein
LLNGDLVARDRRIDRKYGIGLSHQIQVARFYRFSAGMILAELTLAENPVVVTAKDTKITKTFKNNVCFLFPNIISSPCVLNVSNFFFIFT